MTQALHHALSVGGYNARSYIQRNLALHFFGPENAGFGEHSATALTWTNLGNRGGAFDATRASGTFAANGATISRSVGAANIFTIPGGVFNEVMRGEWAYEIVFTPTANWFTTYSGVWGAHGSESLGVVGGQYEGGVFAFNLHTPSTTLYRPSESTFSAGATYTVSQSASNTTRTARTWLNGTLVASVQDVDVLLTYANKGYIGTAFQPEVQRAFDGVVHALRIYDTAIDESVVTANRIVDLAFFA